MNIYVGNLSYKAEERDLLEVFEPYGAVTSVKIVTDRETGSARGFCFVEMLNDDEAQEAIEALDQAAILGRPVIVKQARERQPRPPYGG